MESKIADLPEPPSTPILPSPRVLKPPPTSSTSLVLKNRIADSEFSSIVYEIEGTPMAQSKSASLEFSSPSTTTTTSSNVSKKKSGDSHLFAKLEILLSRSSGRDKFCAFLQYGSMLYGNQPFINVSQTRNAPWRNLEDSMSTGRKTLRLFKWIKEFEKMQKAVLYGDPVPHPTEGRTKFMNILGFFLHTFSFAYYFVDNIIYMSQTGLINRPAVLDSKDLRKMLKSGLPHSEYLKLQSKFRSDEILRATSKKYEDRLKDWKNYSSLARLLTSIIYSLILIDSVKISQKVLYKKYKKDGEDEKKRENLDKQLKEYEEMKSDNWKEIIVSLCNLFMLLKRMEFNLFKKIPMWGVGAFGVIASLIGMEKNWPTESVKKSG